MIKELLDKSMKKQNSMQTANTKPSYIGVMRTSINTLSSIGLHWKGTHAFCLINIHHITQWS